MEGDAVEVGEMGILVAAVAVVGGGSMSGKSFQRIPGMIKYQGQGQSRISWLVL